MIGWHKESFLTASTSVQLIAKLIDFTRNTHAEVFNKEIGRTTPVQLSRFGLEQMLEFEATRQSTLVIIKQFVAKRQLVQKFESIINELIDDEKERKVVTDFI